MTQPFPEPPIAPWDEPWFDPRDGVFFEPEDDWLDDWPDDGEGIVIDSLAATVDPLASIPLARRWLLLLALGPGVAVGSKP